MNLSHLYYFRKLAEVRHYTKAAKELFIAQPTLSAAMSQLEKELGAPLFKKHTRSVILTSYGQDFYRYVNSALNDLDKGIELVQEASGRRKATVRIGAIYAIQDDLWSRTIKAFRNSLNAAVTLDIRQDRTPTLLSELKNGNYDVVFSGSLSADPDIISVPYRSLDLTLAVNKQHPLAQQQSVTLEQLRPYHLLSYASKSSVYGGLSSVMERAGLNPDSSCSDAITMCALASSDASHVALVIDSFIIHSFNDVVTVDIAGIPKGFHQIYLSFRNDEYSPDIVKHFVEYFLRNAPDVGKEPEKIANALMMLGSRLPLPSPERTSPDVAASRTGD